MCCAAQADGNGTLERAELVTMLQRINPSYSQAFCDRVFDLAARPRDSKQRSSANPKVGCVIAQAFFSRGASEISLNSRVFQRNLMSFCVI